jgi:hypothetical protein
MLQEMIAGMMAATTGLTALFMILRYRTKARGQLPTENTDRLLETQEQILNALEDLREEMHSGQEDVRELSGRVEFAERLLAKSKDELG